MSTSNPEQKKAERKRVKLSVRFLLFLIVVAALVPVAYAGWSELYGTFLEHGAPQIHEVGQFPRGIGVAPVTIRWRLSDNGAGLDEVVVRTKQKGVVREVLRQKLERRPQVQIEVSFQGQESDLEEGQVDVIVRAFDASFWSNAAEKIYPLTVDFRKPDLRVVSTQHNASQGGSQLVLYEAYDDNIAVSGVRVGRHTFIGYSAKGLDPAFAGNKDLYACIYAIDGQEPDAEKLSPRVFAEDTVGNAKSTSFYNKVFAQRWGALRIVLPERFMRDQVTMLAENNYLKLRQAARETGRSIEYSGPAGSTARLIEQFKLVNEDLRRINYNEMEALLKSRGSFEKLWRDEFARPAGIARAEYGHTLRFMYQGEAVGSAFSQGYEMLPTTADKAVTAANNGVVIFSDNIGVYGRVIGIDHGLGVFTTYGHLDSAAVSSGDMVEAGQLIGYAGESGFAVAGGVHFEVWVQSVPVNPREWWDKNWYYSHFTDKIAAAKKSLGIPVYEPFGAPRQIP